MGLGIAVAVGRAPYGARGLKCEQWTDKPIVNDGSRPVWGAWIEIVNSFESNLNFAGRAPYGARGLKYIPIIRAWIFSVAPRMGRVD